MSKFEIGTASCELCWGVTVAVVRVATAGGRVSTPAICSECIEYMANEREEKSTRIASECES